MPTYEYECDACGHQFEKYQPMTAAAVKTCPKCRKTKVRRLISLGGGVLFKGSGFYQTDYRSKGYQEKAKKETEASSPEKKAEASPAVKKEKTDKKDKKDKKGE